MLVQVVVVVVVVAAALRGFPCRCNVPQGVPPSRVRVRVRARRSSWADTGCSVAWDPLLPSLRRWSGTDGCTPLQIHKRKHQPVSRTPARGREGPFSRNLSPLVTEMQSPATPQAASRNALVVPPLTVRSLCQQPWSNHLGHFVCMPTWTGQSSGEKGREVTASGKQGRAMQNHTGAEHVNVQA